jgi:glyceraldehyde 3-phosphate dehydrogenase
MTTRIGINGFGRIGRQILRIVQQQSYKQKLEVVAVSSRRKTDLLAHLFKYDSTYGRYSGTVESTEDSIVVDGKPVKVLPALEPSQIPWGDCDVELVVEATGIYRDAAKVAGHLEHGAKKVIITAPGRGVDLNICFGINEGQYNPATHKIISAASCTTNCLCPVVKVLLDNFGIRRGFLTTVHAYTNDQVILDKSHADLRRARAAAINIIPTTTGAARAVADVLPEVKGKIDGIALRVPTVTVSIVDFVADVEREKVSVEEVNQALQTAAHGDLKGILEFCDEELVSTDFIGSTASSIVDGPSTAVIDNNMVKVLAWYDNEWGYSCRVVDLAAYMAEKGL